MIISMKTRFTLLLGILLLLGIFGWSQTSTTGTINVGGTTRSYRLYFPPGFSPGTPAPLVFNLHGYGMNAAQEEFYTEMNAVADTAGFVVCYPEGIGNAWNVGFVGAYHAGVDDVGFISALIDQLYFQYQIDLTRVYACGLSNGGFMSYRLACELSHKLAAIASVAGSMTDSIHAYCATIGSFPIMHIHGTDDQTVLFNGVPGYHWSAPASIQRWTTANQCNPPVLDTVPNTVLGDSCTVTSQRWNSCYPISKVLFLKVEDGGHTWPGTIYTANFGHTNQDIHGSREIWEFFLDFFNPNVSLSVNPANQPALATVFPNPSTGTIQIHWPHQSGNGQLISPEGRIIREFSFIESIQLSDLPIGFYTLLLHSSNERVTKGVAVVQ